MKKKKKHYINVFEILFTVVNMSFIAYAIKLTIDGEGGNGLEWFMYLSLFVLTIVIIGVLGYKNVSKKVLFRNIIEMGGYILVPFLTLASMVDIGRYLRINHKVVGYILLLIFGILDIPIVFNSMFSKVHYLNENLLRMNKDPH